MINAIANIIFNQLLLKLLKQTTNYFTLYSISSQKIKYVAMYFKPIKHLIQAVFLSS